MGDEKTLEEEVVEIRAKRLRAYKIEKLIEAQEYRVRLRNEYDDKIKRIIKQEEEIKELQGIPNIEGACYKSN